MKIILRVVILSLLLSGNAYSALDGAGELKLSQNMVNAFKNYLRGNTTNDGKSNNNKPMVFYVTTDGTDGLYWYCTHGSCSGSYASPAEDKKVCEARTGKECFRFARKNSVRWKNGINPGKGKESKFNGKMTDTEIVAKLTELGFLGNSISSTTTTPKITKKKEIKSSNITKQLTELKKLLDDGVLTQDEFEKAKKKLLN
jgi:hypothetical protein